MKRLAIIIVAGLFSRVKPGGTLIIGNMKAHTNNVWALGFVCPDTSREMLFSISRPVCSRKEEKLSVSDGRGEKLG